MFKKIKNWFINLNKQKCPNCKSVELKQLEKSFLHTSKKPYYNHSKYEAPSDRAIKEFYSAPDGYDDYKVYDVKYQCKNCNCNFNKKIEV